MTMFLIIAFLFAALESYALWKGPHKLEYVAKPAVMVFLLAYLWTSNASRVPLAWFSFGLIFSLLGDVLLMLSLDRMFLAGLAAFLLAHVAYIVGFNIPLPEASGWGFAFAFIVAIGGARVIRRILSAVQSKQMRIPISVYGLVISVMLLSAMIKLTDMTWGSNAALLVTVGAFLFYISDIILAWNKFVSPIPHGRILNIGAYHLGQIALIAGVVAQFGGNY